MQFATLKNTKVDENLQKVNNGLMPEFYAKSIEIIISKSNMSKRSTYSNQKFSEEEKSQHNSRSKNYR